MLLNQVIDEIKALQVHPSPRSISEMLRLLENNRHKFKGHIAPEDLEMLIRELRNLSDARAADYETSSFRRDYEKACNSLLFYFNRIL